MVDKAASEITDRTVDSSALASFGTFQEINEGRAALVSAQKQHSDDLKSGRVRSFVTNELGKLVIVNDEKPIGAGLELKGASHKHARVAESKDAKAATAPHETDRGLVNTHREKDGTRTYTYKDKTTEVVSPDGKDREVKFPDGSGYHLLPDGRKIVRNGNDANDSYDRDGNLEWRMRTRPNGDVVHTNVQGRLADYSGATGDHYAYFGYDADGKLESVAAAQPVGDWKREQRPDGRTYWQNSSDPKQQFYGEITVDGDGNIRLTPDDPAADVRIFKHAGASTEVAKRTDPVETREYDPVTGKLVSWKETDGQGTSSRTFDKNTGKMTSSERINRDGSWERSEFAENGMRTTLVRNDGKGGKEEIVLDPATGKEVASDIKFKDGSTMHVGFDAEGNMKELSSKDKDGNINQWKAGADGGAVVTDVSRPEPLGGIGAKEIKFPNGFKVHVDFAPSSSNITGIWTSDRDMDGVRDVHIASIKRK